MDYRKYSRISTRPPDECAKFLALKRMWCKYCMKWMGKEQFYNRSNLVCIMHCRELQNKYVEQRAKEFPNPTRNQALWLLRSAAKMLTVEDIQALRKMVESGTWNLEKDAGQAGSAEEKLAARKNGSGQPETDRHAGVGNNPALSERAGMDTDRSGICTR